MGLSLFSSVWRLSGGSKNLALRPPATAAPFAQSHPRTEVLEVSAVGPVRVGERESVCRGLPDEQAPSRGDGR